MLLVFAHPDDESFSCGLTVSKYVTNGWNVELLVATRGDAGMTGDLGEMSKEQLGRVREGELEKAAKILGISKVQNMGYKDGYLDTIEAGELEDAIYKKMIEYSPDIVVTYDPTGISNHPDHMRISRSTTYAFQRYSGDILDTREMIAKVNARDESVKVRNFSVHHKAALKEKSFAEVVESQTEPKLYYVCIPESVVTYLKKQKIMPEESFGRPVIGTPDKFITTVIDGGNFVHTKLKALAAHITQREDVDRFYETDTNPLTRQEYFILRMQGFTEVFMGKNDRISDKL